MAMLRFTSAVLVTAGDSSTDTFARFPASASTPLDIVGANPMGKSYRSDRDNSRKLAARFRLERINEALENANDYDNGIDDDPSEDSQEMRVEE
jgi:hypothetical protein